MAQKAQRCAELRNHSTLTTSHKLGPGLPSRCTYHPSHTSRLVVLVSSHAIRLISLFTAPCVTSPCNLGGLRRAPPKIWKLVGHPFTLSRRSALSPYLGLLGGCCSHCLPGKEAVAWPACWETHAGFVCAPPELPPDGAIARLHC